MRKTKEERIKKLKKIHIWPSLLGLFFVLLLFGVVMAAAFGVSGLDIVQRKLTNNARQSMKVAEVFADYSPEKREQMEHTVQSHIDVLEEIEAVAVFDAERNGVWSSNGEFPFFDDTMKIEGLPGTIEDNIHVVIADDKAQVFTIDDGTIVFNETALVNVISLKSLQTGTPFTYLKLWLVIPVDSLEVLVLNNIPVYFSDFLMMAVCIGLCGLLIAFFVIYYLISVISMVSSVRKTTRIIYTDMVTGGDNWLLFTKKGTSLLKKNRRGHRNYAVVHLEMRKYRSFCTCFGVSRGQELIENFYLIMKNQIKKYEVCAHQENAEFGLLLAYTDKKQLEDRIADLQSSLSTVLPGMKLYFGIGVYLVQAGEKDVEQLYNNAMIACEMLREDAEQTIAFFDVEMNHQKLWERKVEDDMERALANREFQVYLQPKISTSEETLGGAEALVRWIHPTEGFFLQINLYQFLKRMGLYCT